MSTSEMLVKMLVVVFYFLVVTIVSFCMQAIPSFDRFLLQHGWVQLYKSLDYIMDDASVV